MADWAQRPEIDEASWAGSARGDGVGSDDEDEAGTEVGGPGTEDDVATPQAHWQSPVTAAAAAAVAAVAASSPSSGVDGRDGPRSGTTSSAARKLYF